MNINLAKAISVLSRMALPLEIKSSRVNIKGTTVYVKKERSSISIGSSKMPELDLGFGLDDFNVEMFLQRIHQALHTELDPVSGIIISGIYNTIPTVDLSINEIYIENPETNTSIIILPFGQSLAVSVFHGVISDGFVKATMVLPLANDPVKYSKIIKSIS